jgi:hypothetical protein
MPVIKQPGFTYKARLFIFSILLLAGLLIVFSAIALILWADKMPQSLLLWIIFIVIFSSTIAATTSLFLAPFLESYLSNIFTPAGNIELVRVSNHIVEPGERFRPSVTVEVKSGELREDRGDVLRCNDPNCGSDSIVRFGALPHVEVKGTTRMGQDYTFTFYENGSMIAPDTLGEYTSKWRVWQAGHWAGPNIPITFRVEPPTSIVPTPNSAELSLAFSDDFNDGNAVRGHVKPAREGQVKPGHLR